MYVPTAPETTSTRTSRSARRAAVRPHGRINWRMPTTRALEVPALILIAVLLVAGLFMTRGPRVESPSFSQRLKIHAGDSLWTVASEHPVEGMTTAQLVDLLAETNRLNDHAVRPGQVISVPAGTPDERVASR